MSKTFTIHTDLSYAMEIVAPMACFSRVDSCGIAPVSYEVPTPTAARAIFDSIVGVHFKAGRCMTPVKLEVCNPIRMESYATNYRGPLRKSSQKASGSSLQYKAKVLVNQRWILHASPLTLSGSRHDAVAIGSMFSRYIKKGKCLRVPCCGWSEFIPDYFGEVRDDAKADKSINISIGNFLWKMFDAPMNGNERVVTKDVEVVEGVLSYVD